jgi:catechol 2,3-dioxygenase-like lactoylglutathione lyase family enzyme
VGARRTFNGFVQNDQHPAPCLWVPRLTRAAVIILESGGSSKRQNQRLGRRLSLTRSGFRALRPSASVHPIAAQQATSNREVSMRVLISALFLATLTATTASAQPYKPNEAGVTMGHWHLNSANIEANKKIFVGMGGTASEGNGLSRVTFPGVVIILNIRDPKPSTGGTRGSVVNHVGFVVNNVQEQVAKWKANGVAVLPGGNNRLDQAYVETPDGLRIEILEDKNQKEAVRHEHVHFFLPEAEIAKSQAWYGKIFGAKAGVRGENKAPVADVPGAQLRFNKADKAQEPTKGRTLDHIGFDVVDLKAFIQKLDANGIKLDRPYTDQGGGASLAFITDPWGTYIELNQRPNPAYLP